MVPEHLYAPSEQQLKPSPDAHRRRFTNTICDLLGCHRRFVFCIATIKSSPKRPKLQAATANFREEHQFSDLRHQSGVKLHKFRSALLRTYSDVERNHTLQMAAALSYYFVMALFPALIFLSAIVAFLPLAGLFDQTLDLMGRFVPPEGMEIVRKVLSDAITPNRGTFLSVGFLGTLWTASGGFAAAIEALNIAYDVDETRPSGRPDFSPCFSPW